MVLWWQLLITFAVVCAFDKDITQIWKRSVVPMWPLHPFRKEERQVYIILCPFFHCWIHKFNHFYRLVVSRSSPKCEEVGIHWGVGTKIRNDKLKSRFGWSQDSAMARILKQIWAALVFTRNQKPSPGPTAWWVRLHAYFTMLCPLLGKGLGSAQDPQQK